ncbi:MAG: hypothetical protein LAO07_03505, partial [Acidobacteriia bacterium]|nr:hypothetical protein [Terriglobia bacterium]
IALLIAYGVALFIRPSVAQFWERDDLFERATRRGFIASASGTWEAAPGDSFTRISSRLRRQVPPKLYCLRLSTLALFLVYLLIILVTTFMLAEGYGRSWRANRMMGLRVYVAGPSGMMLPDLERGQERLLVKVTSEPEQGSAEFGVFELCGSLNRKRVATVRNFLTLGFSHFTKPRLIPRPD